MPDAASGPSKSQDNAECSSLYQTMLAAKREVESAIEARSSLIGVGLQDDSESETARRQAFDNEQRALDHYLQTLYDYNKFLLKNGAANGT